MKQYDYLLASLNNPDFTSGDFKDIAGMNLANTQFASKDLYKNNPKIRSLKIFQDSLGNFSEQKFNDYYDNVASSFKDFSTESSVDDYEYSMWDTRRPKGAKVKSINLQLNTVNNPDHIRIGVEGINAVTYSDKSRRELALNSKIYDPATGTFLNKSVNDISLFSNPFEYIKSLFDDPLVYATYDKDTVEIDPITGNKVKHKKGEWKVNEDGEYYTEKANGRSLHGKTVVSATDYLTSENSPLHKYDFMDSDGLDKSVAGSIAKNVAAVLPMFIPYVNTAYSGLLVGRELAKTLPMAYGMISSLMGDKNPNSQLANTISAYGLRLSSSTSDYALENTFAFENFGNLMSDVALQWGQLKLIANTFNKLRGGGEEIMNTATAKALKTYMDKANKYLQESLEGKISKALLTSYLGTDDPYNIGKLFLSGKWAETSLGKAALNKYIPEAERIMQNRNRLAQDLSLGYMALISNTDVYESVLDKGGTPAEAAAIAFGSTLGMYSVDRYLGLGEMFFLKDGARAAIRKSARENAALYMAGKKEAVDTTTKKGIIGVILKGIDLGKRTVNKFGEKYKDGTLGLFGKAIGEGTEEVSEELVTDLTKSLAELAGKLGYFSQTDYGAWEDMGGRYIMSFLGGAAGGGIFGLKEAWENRNTKAKEFLSEITYLLRLGKKDEILSELSKLRDKGSLGSADLSYDSTINSDGSKTFISADENHKSLAQSNYEGLTNIINLLDMILNSNLLNLSEDELFDKMVQGEYRANALTDFLKGNNIENVKDLSYISKYQEDFLNLADSIVNIESRILDHVNKYNDEEKRKNPKYEEELQKLEDEKQALIEKRDYLFGEGSLGYVEKTLFAMDTNLSGRFVSLNINLFARELTGKSIQQLTPAELSTVQSKFEKWQENGKQELDDAFKLYKDMEKQVLPELTDLLNTDFNKELKAIEQLRKNDPSKKILKETDKLDTETNEEFASLAAPLEGESEEDFTARRKKHADAIRKYNIDNQFNWILEFAKQPITSTDFRYFVSQVGALRQELLKYYLDNIAEKSEGDVKKHWWEMHLSSKDDNEVSEDDISDINKQNKDLYDIILKKGILDVAELKKAINTRIKETAESIINRRYKSVGALSDLIGTFKFISNFTEDEKEGYDIPSDYEFKDDGFITYMDLYALTRYDIKGLGYTEELVWDDLNEFLDQDVVERFLETYADAILNSDILSSDVMNTVVDITYDKHKELVDDLFKSISEPYLKNLDTFIKGVNNAPLVKTLNALEGATFINNPVIPLLNKISKFSPNSNVNIEELLQDVYNTYNSQETNADFLLSNAQLAALKQVLEDFKTAEAFIYGASVKETDSTPVGHNKSINDFVKNHKDVFGKAEELPEIDEADANMLLGEIAAYRREINSWLDKHEQNSGLREAKFIKANQALTKSIRSFFELNRVAFKISPTLDLLDGYEDLTLDDSLSSIVALQLLLYNNSKKAKMPISDILDKLSPNIFDANQVVGQESAKLDENLTYDKFTHYDKFQLIVSSMAASTVKYYKGLKSFLDANKNMAPVSILEYVSKLAFALNENPTMINDALDWLKKKTGSKMNIAHNTSIVTGLGGSGKTFAVARLNLGTGKDTWVSGPAKSLVENLKNSLTDSTEKAKSELLSTIFGGKVPNFKDLYSTTKDHGSTVVNLKEDIGIKKIDNAPKNLVIDEATHFSTPEILAISKFCELNGINLILIGDEHQNGYYSNTGSIGNIEENSLIAWRSPSIYLSLRNGNALKVSNQQPLLLVIDALSVEDPESIAKSIYDNIFKNVQLRYYNKDVFSGELITDSVPDDVIAKIPKDASIGFIGDVDSAEYKKLLDAGLNVSDPLSPTDVQGREFDYTIVDKKWNLDIGDNWNNNGININQFAKDLYTLITRSTKGTIIIDNGLSKIVHNSESEFNGEYKGLDSSIEKFREKRIPEIEKAIADNPEVSEVKELEDAEEEKSVGNNTDDKVVIGGEEITEDDLKEEEEPVKKDGDNSAEVADSQESEMDLNLIMSNPVITYSNISYSGINTAMDTWINDTNSTSDLGIFVEPGVQVNKGLKVDLMRKVIQLKNIIIYGTEYYDSLPTETRRKFSKDAFNNILYFIKIEDISDSNRLIGLTEGSGLTNENRGVRGKVIKLVAKIKGKDGITYSVSLGGLNNPDTWEKNKSTIKSAIKRRIDEGASNSDELLKLYDSYDDTVAKYSTIVDGWVTLNQEFRINPPKFSKYTRLVNLDSSYRLEDADSTRSPYRSKAPLLVESDIHIVIDDIPGISPEMRGKPVMFVSSNLLLSPSELKDLYIKQTLDPNLPKLVRMVRLDNVGVSFKSLYQKKWTELYHNKAGNCTFTTPMELLPFAIRMYMSMWNYRAGLSRFVERYETFCNENNLNDDDIHKLCKADNDEYQRIKGNAESLDESEYRKAVAPDLAERLKVLWDFNDSLADYVKEFRLGYSSTHGAYIRKLTNIDSKFYDKPESALGIYINPEIAKTQLAVLNKIFTNIVDTIIPPTENNHKSYITTKLRDWVDEDGKNKGKWFDNVSETNSIELDFQEGDASTRSTLHISDKSNLTTLPLVMIKAAHYMNIQMTEGKENFLERVRQNFEDGRECYVIKYLDKYLPWLDIIDSIDNQVAADKNATYTSDIPGVIPYDSKSGTGVYDSRIDDLFNLMFHGVVSTPVENDFTRDNPRATAAQFKYGIFSDPILVEKKNEGSNQVDRTLTNRKLFSANAVSSGPLIAVDINPYVEESTEGKLDSKKQEVIPENPVLKAHNNISNQLETVGITINPNNYSSVESYMKGVKGKISDKLIDYIKNGADIDFEHAIIGMNPDGSLMFLKDLPDFWGKTFKGREILSANSIRLIFEKDGKTYNYNISYNGELTITADNDAEIRPEKLTALEIKQNIMDVIGNPSYTNLGKEGLNLLKETIENYLNRNVTGDAAWDAYEKIVNNVAKEVEELLEDGADQIKELLNKLLNNKCSI